MGKRKALSGSEKAALIMLSGRKLRPMDEPPTAQDALYADSDTIGIILRRLLDLESKVRGIDKRLLNLEEGE